MLALFLVRALFSSHMDSKIDIHSLLISIRILISNIRLDSNRIFAICMLFRTPKRKCASESNHTTTTRIQFEPILANFRTFALELTHLAFTSQWLLKWCRRVVMDGRRVV